MTPEQLATLLLLASVALVLTRALAGPSVYDRVLAINAIGTKAVLLLVLLGALQGRSGYLDIAILYALINYVATIGLLKLVTNRRLG